MLAWTYAGVNFSISGTGGPQCLQFLSAKQRIFETVVAVGTFSYLAYWSWLRLASPHPNPQNSSMKLRKTFLLFHYVIFGLELCYKLASESLIWILNPCHILTIMQIFLLACRPSKLTTSIFRLHVHMLNGPLLALAFPVLNTRLLPFECVVYFIQHALILLFPIILMDQNSDFSVEPLDDPFWTVLSLSLQVLYHFVVLQPIALLTGVNLNSILCPAVSDPFNGPYYRLLALLHQPFVILVFGKCITCFSLTWNAQPWPWRTPTGYLPSDQPVMDIQLTDPDALLSPWISPDVDRDDVPLASPFNWQTGILGKSPQPACTLSKRVVASSEMIAPPSAESILDAS
ncbi:unnamed protein product [Dicrocoelium dendriticum]|nr:unnamed protein product [Dicrocoelium dendriticum]